MLREAGETETPVMLSLAATTTLLPGCAPSFTRRLTVPPPATSSVSSSMTRLPASRPARISVRSAVHLLLGVSDVDLVFLIAYVERCHGLHRDKVHNGI